MKNVKLILASFCLVFVGCDDDDDVVAADSCTTYLMSYMEYTDAIAAGTATAADCVDGTTTLQDWCVAGCEADDTPEEQAVCDETFEALTTEEITASCDALFPSDDDSHEHCEDFTTESDCGMHSECEWHADDNACEDADDHAHEHCEDITTQSECDASDECEWHEHGDESACEDAHDHGDCPEEDHADVDGFILERDGVEIYRQFQGAVTGDVTIDVGEMVDIAVHFLDENETVIEGGYTSECYGLEFEIADPSIISIELEDHDHDHEETHCDDLTNQADCDASDECEWHADDSMCEEVGHEDGEHDGEDHYEFELTGLVENSTTFQMSIMHTGHADYTSMEVLVTVIPSVNFISENPLDN